MNIPSRITGLTGKDNGIAIGNVTLGTEIPNVVNVVNVVRSTPYPTGASILITAEANEMDDRDRACHFVTSCW